jgi:hypothetical protein
MWSAKPLISTYGSPDVSYNERHAVRRTLQECVLRHDIPILNRSGDTTSNVILGEIVMFHIAEGLLDPDKKAAEVSADKLLPVARLGGSTFAALGELFDYPRPQGRRR